MLTPSQKKTLNLSGLDKIQLTETEIAEIASQNDCRLLSDDQLIDFLKITNVLYRAGEPVISDSVYDRVFLEELRQRQPNHPFLHTVEPEPAFRGKTIQLPVQMLSTDKAYTRESIEKWLVRVEKAAQEISLDFDSLVFRVTPKLDGYAAYDDGKLLYTRGDGRRGTDISRVFERGLVVGGDGKRGHGAGEIVVSQSYFAKQLAAHFDNARNFQASVIKEKELDQHALAAIKSKAAIFFPFSQLPDRYGTASMIIENFDNLIEEVLGLVDYDVDGVIFEATDDVLKQHMGSTRHHHRWQIAFKNNLETAEVEVLQVAAQTSRSGRVNPVAELEPTRLSGAMISRASAHHYGMVKNLGIGPGTMIELTRSGMVIPKIERVIIPAEPQIPDRCPSCGTELIWDSDYLYCPNKSQCPAQIENTIEHFFRTLANVDGFGRKTVEKLHENGVELVYEVYQLNMDKLQAMGFGEKTARNLLDQLERSKADPIEDWRFLGAFGIHRMGLGNCERLLQHFPLMEIFSLSVDDIINIEGFAEKTAEAVVVSLKNIQPDFMRIYQLGFNLLITRSLSDRIEGENLSPLFNKAIVFTGTMKRAKREEMKKEAKQLGAKVGNSVTGKTDYLVAGEKVGAAKISDARDKGITVLSEEEYYALCRADEL